MKKKFDNLFSNDVVCGPIYRGAPFPKFDPSKINEKNFDDELREKWSSFKFIEGDDYTNDTIAIEWESQEWTDDIESLVNEIARFLKYHHFIGNVELTIYERGYKGTGECEAYREFEIVN